MTSSLPVCVVIPIYNEARFIGTLVERLLRITSHVVVVDDGSSDGSAEHASRAGATVLRHPYCRGKGAALGTGFRYALSRNYPAVVTMDGDLQHDPEELPTLVRYAETTGADFVLGIRRRDPARMPWLRRQVNSSSSALLSLLTGKQFHDIHSGYRWIHADILRRIHVRSERFDAELELLFKACRAGFTVREVPIQTLYGDEVSHIRPWKDTLRFFRILFLCTIGL